MGSQRGETDDLRARGARLTPQRLMVLEALRTLGGHRTADAVAAQVRIAYPYINRATVYRALGWLRDQGLVSETDLGGGQAEFEYLGAARHHHMICLACGHTVAFDDDLVAPLGRALFDRHGFAARIDHLAIFGLCRQCQEATPA